MTYQAHHRPSPVEPRRRFPFHKIRLFRGPRAGQPRAWLPSFWWLSVLGLGAVSLLLMAWGAYCLTPNSSEKDLRVAIVSPKLSIKGSEVPRNPAPTEKEVVAPKKKDAEPAPLAVPHPAIPIEPIPVVPPPAPLPPPVSAKPKLEPVKVEPDLVALPPLPTPTLEPVEVLPLKVKPAALALPKIEPPAPVVEAPVAQLPKAPSVVPPPPVIAIEAPAPRIPDHPLPFVARNSNLGDTPMMRNWKMVAFYSLFASALGQTPVLAGEPSDGKEILKQINALKKEANERLDKLQDSSNDIKEDLKDLKGTVTGLKGKVEKLQADFTSLSAQLGTAKGRIDELETTVADLKVKVNLLTGKPANGAPVNGLDKATLDELRIKLSNIEAAIARLQPTEVRKALFPPTVSTTGRVVLVNVYGERLMFLLGGKPYAVEPNTTLPVNDIPTGALNYEVRSPTYGVVSRGTTVLNPNDLFTLTAR